MLFSVCLAIFALNLASMRVEARHEKTPVVQSAAEQKWLEERNELREKEFESERNRGRVFKNHGEWHFLISPAIPALVVCAILFVYLCYVSLLQKMQRRRLD
jgi:hypothetical protein